MSWKSGLSRFGSGDMIVHLREMGPIVLALACVAGIGGWCGELVAQEAAANLTMADLPRLEADARNLAYREAKVADTLGAQHPQRVALRNELTQVVGQVFAIRQAALRDEASRLRRRLADLEQTIAARDRQAEEQVASRVRDLLGEAASDKSTFPPTAARSTATTSPATANAAERALGKEHVAKLKELCEAANELFLGGRGDLEPAISARRDRFDAEYSLATTPEERREVVKSWRSDLAALNVVVQARFQNGVANVLHVRLIESELKRAERVWITLEPEKSNPMGDNPPELPGPASSGVGAAAVDQEQARGELP